ncbi:hypothetical protein D3C71_1663680 [compost metagenome]
MACSYCFKRMFSQAKGFQPECFSLRCRFSSRGALVRLGHPSTGHDCLGLWVKAWLSRVVFSANNLSHVGCSQAKDFTPVCICPCVARPSFRANVLPHPSSSQAYGLTPRCVRKCFERVLLSANVRSHVVQANGLSPLCVRICAVRKCFLEKNLPHAGSWQT